MRTGGRGYAAATTFAGRRRVPLCHEPRYHGPLKHYFNTQLSQLTSATIRILDGTSLQYTTLQISRCVNGRCSCRRSVFLVNVSFNLHIPLVLIKFPQPLPHLSTRNTTPPPSLSSHKNPQLSSIAIIHNLNHGGYYPPPPHNTKS